VEGHVPTGKKVKASLKKPTSQGQAWVSAGSIRVESAPLTATGILLDSQPV